MSVATLLSSQQLHMSAAQFSSDEDVMRRAIELARQGIGYVEPNPAVGAVLVDGDRNRLGEGWHQRFGEAHAEVRAFADFAARHPDSDEQKRLAESATLFVTLEPCCHSGKTPPCTDAVLASGVRRVVIGIRDPSPHVDGGGVAILRQAGIEVSVGLLEQDVRRLNAPFLKLLTTGLPYVHVKWAMTLDGKIATRTGSSQWISNEKSRAIVHELRGRMDAIIVGVGTARADDPSLTARPPGPRTATRVVVDSTANLPADSQLVETATEIPVLVATLDCHPESRVSILRSKGVEVISPRATPDGIRLFPKHMRPDLRSLLLELGSRGMTNVLIEGGGELLGTLFDLDDEERMIIALSDLNTVTIPSEVFELIPEPIARECCALPLRVWKDTLTVAIPDPQQFEVIDKLRFALNIEIVALAADQREIEEALDRHYGGNTESTKNGSSTHYGIVDEAHVFVAPKFAGGADAISPVAGVGLDRIPQIAQIDPLQIETLDGDVYIHGPIVNRGPAHS